MPRASRAASAAAASTARVRVRQHARPGNAGCFRPGAVRGFVRLEEFMPRRSRPERREVVPDARYSSRTVAMFTKKLRTSGKKTTAERIMYEALDLVGQRSNRPPIDL